MEVIFTLDDIKAAAAEFLQVIGPARVVALHGEMGAGKTTFVHAVCDVLGVTEAVSSPTFSIINQYEGANGQLIYHLDLYRLKDEEEALLAGVEDCLYSGQYCFAEWPEKAPGIFPEHSIHLQIDTVNMNSRKLSFNL